ncbi:MAG: NAD-binding protein [Pseudomonadota bacterium]
MLNIVFVLLRRLQVPLVVLIVAYAAAVLGFVLIPGKDDHGQPWDMGFLHAFYVVSYTATTIGFGELPYLFTDMQRLWMTLVVYVTVIAWMYAIGMILALIQDSAIRTLMKEQLFVRHVRRIVEPFYLLCGYGNSGGSLVRGLTGAGLRVVVVDSDSAAIDALSIEDLPLPVPGLCRDAGLPDTLVMAGLQSRHCAGVLVLTKDDEVNVKIAIATKLLCPQLLTIVRVHTQAFADTLATFGVDYTLNQYDLFTRIFKNAVHAPSLYALDERLTSVPNEAWSPPLEVPRGHWIVCGYGRFGQAMHKALHDEGVSCTFIATEKNNAARAPRHVVVGEATSVDVLVEAGVRDASAIIAGTGDDMRNLAIVMTARRLNPTIFVVARQLHIDNDALFRAAAIPLVLQHGQVLAGEAFTIITSPLVVDFLRLTEQHDEAWADALHRRIHAYTGEHNPDRWTVDVRSNSAPAICLVLARGRRISIGDLCRDTNERARYTPSIALLLKRESEFTLLPVATLEVRKGDKILFCGVKEARKQMEWVTRNHNVCHYILTGEESTRNIATLITPRTARVKKRQS